MRLLFGIAATIATLASCDKVPIYSVEAGFSRADVSWFAEEETLFVFYEVSAEQGIGEPSVIELTYATDEERVDWTPIEEFTAVHTHLPVDCGVNARCGSWSISVPLEPREVEIRLRYHREGRLSLLPATVYNVIGLGPSHSNRSLLIYGVFDEPNQHVQWRSRHQFPTLRNHDAENLGLRRDFSVSSQGYGDIVTPPAENPYGYGEACPTDFVPMTVNDVATNERAVFNIEAIPIEAAELSGVCAQATVTDAKGNFTTAAQAKKNPEVRSAFPILKSPVHDVTRIEFFMSPCGYIINEQHRAMQRQRLLMDGLPTYCIDDWESPNFISTLVVAFRDAIENERPAGQDMILVVVLNQDEQGVSAAVEEAMSQVLPFERHKSTPRVVGGFVYDSTGHGLRHADLSASTLWCPARSSDGFPDASNRSCPTLPDIPDFVLGPFTFGSLQILPSRVEYLDFIDTYSDAQAGEVTKLEFLSPEFAADTDHVDLGEFGVVAFLNGESFPADADDAFSYCAPEEPLPFVLRSESSQNPDVLAALANYCVNEETPPPVCEVLSTGGLIGLSTLPHWHNLIPDTNYQIGMFYEFPFLMRMEYRAFGAVNISAFGLSVPFGFENTDETLYGASVWLDDEFSLGRTLGHCQRFCDHPTFDSAAVYNVTQAYRQTYANACYFPDYPERGDPGDPLDP